MKKYLLLFVFISLSLFVFCFWNSKGDEIKKISINEAIESGEYYTFYKERYSKVYNYKLKIISFEKISQENLSNIEDLEYVGDGILWIMKVEVENIDKTPLDPYYVGEYLRIIDQEGFSFQRYNESELCHHSEYAEESGLIRFTGWSDVPDMNPKIKEKGAIAFLLPDEESIYYLAIEDGKIFN